MRNNILMRPSADPAEKETNAADESGQPLLLPLVQLPEGKTVNLTDFDFDDLLT